MPHYTQAIPECLSEENSQEKPTVDLPEETEMAEETVLTDEIKELQKTEKLQDLLYIRIASISALAGSLFTLGIIGWYTLLTHCRNPNL
jgi:hypothetical protein